jgi:predicted nucleotidyltransferase
MDLNILLKDVYSQITNLYEEYLEKIILFGSYARGDFKKYSDIDIMVLVNCDNDKIKELDNGISQIGENICNEYDIISQIMVFNINYFNEWQHHMPLFVNVVKDGVLLSG